VSSLRTALEEAIAANPDDRAAHSAYADLLMEEGDPRGEFVQVQLALEDPACTDDRRKELKRRELDLLAHERDWLGLLGPIVLATRPFADSTRAGRVDWARGWLESLYLWQFDFTAARALVHSPVAGLLRQLDLHTVMWYNAGKEPEGGILPDDNVPTGGLFTALYALQNAPFLPHLRWLRIGEEVNFKDWHYNNEAHGQGLVEVLEKTAVLEELHVLAHGVALDRLFALTNLSRLRYLLVYHNPEVYPLEVLATNPALPALETLRLHPAYTDTEPAEGSYLPRAGVAALLRSPHFPALRNLHLHASDLGDEGCRDIVESGILKRLNVLDLRYGTIGDDGARILAACPDIRRLEHLSLANNQLSDDGCALLHGLGIEALLDFQNEPGSDEHQWSGDME
jgi:uncharacterized protein (TIGR02996 family)